MWRTPPSPTALASLEQAVVSGAMSDTDPSLRAQLIEARDKVRRELEILSAPSSIGGGADDRSVVAALQAELRELEAALANRP